VPLSRRDFLKLGSILSGAFAATRLAPRLSPRAASSAASLPNILILVFDAMSAKNLSLYGYRRKTTPNLERFAARATVYDQHYSAGSFTTPGTASLLTGLYPWTHRAINEAGLIARGVAGHNLFRALGQRYYRLAYSQNIWDNYFFGQFERDIDKVLSPAAFSLVNEILAEKFGADLVDSHRAFDDLLFQDLEPPGSLEFGLAERLLLERSLNAAASSDYPVGLPRTTNYSLFFRLNDVFDGLMTTVENLKSPSLAYLHLWPPHEPYYPSRSYIGRFADGWAPPPKPYHRLNDPSLKTSDQDLASHRQSYDEYIANLDAEFGRLLDFLTARGILERSYLVVTSDHGHMFERGLEGHITRLLYDPVVRVPLLISSPGQQSRQDVSFPTSSIDLLPTLAHLSGAPVPAWCEGEILPRLGGAEQPERSIFMMDAKGNPAFSPLTDASFALRKGRYKLSYYIGFHEGGSKGVRFELYDIEADPEELNDLYSDSSPIAAALRKELLSKVQAENAKFKPAA
jgi:arylsulfatase A-like enzyme